MSLKTHTPRSLEGLKKIILNGRKLLFTGAKTSTVIPFNKEDELRKSGVLDIVDLSCLEKKINLDGEVVTVQGPVSWQELRLYLHEHSLEVGCWPTDQSAFVLSGLATSATGERCFSHGTIRDQVESLKYMNNKAEIVGLSSRNSITFADGSYQKLYEIYKDYKNAPFPRFEKETDLMIGTEGQLGVITQASLKTFPLRTTAYILLPLDCWKESNSSIKYLKWAREQSEIYSFEFFDSRCIELCNESAMNGEKDYLVFEVEESLLEAFVEKLCQVDESINLEEMMVLDEKKFLSFRVSIPRGVNEFISHNNLVKMGTDAQVRPENFEELLDLYRVMAKKGVDHALFGHIGDCHLHFNFLPKEEQVDECLALLDIFYDNLLNLKGSPFAEHGIGTVKIKYISRFYTKEVLNLFHRLKTEMDPEGIFFPQGFMGAYERS